MKVKALLVAVFVAGLAASIALASPSSDGSGTAAGTTATTSGDHHGHHGNGPRCREIELKGTLAAGSLTLTVEKANKAGKALGSSVSVAYGGKAKVHARLCQAAPGGAPVLQLRELKVEHAPAGTTTAP